MKCIHCGAEISENANFCPICGQNSGKQPNFCMHCGSKVEWNMQFCENCGKPIEKLTQEKEEPEIAAEDVKEAIEKILEKAEEMDEFAPLERLQALTGSPIPENLAGLQQKKELHTGVIEKSAMLDFVMNL